MRACIYLLLSSALSSAACAGASGTVPDSSPQPITCVRDQAPPAGIGVDVETPRFELISGFPARELGTTRTIRVLLPESYGTAADRSYPVLYMHDGQNLFDAATAAFGHEWEVDETVDRLVAQAAIPELIVVGIDNTASRIDEYTPSTDADFDGPTSEKGGKGPEYARFVVDEIKPYIDSRYRTLCGPESTAIAGSSLGGLISFYMGWSYPTVFGRVGALSPSFWWNDRDTITMLEQASRSGAPESRFWIDAGTAEGTQDGDSDGLLDMVDDARDARARLLAFGHTFGRTVGGREVIGAAHEEPAWAARFDDVLLFLMGTSEQPAVTTLTLSTYGDQLAINGPAQDTVLHVNVAASYENGLDMTVPNALASFEIADPGVASIDDSGVIHAIAAGTTTVQAGYGSASAAPVGFEVIDGFSAEVDVIFEITVPAGTPPDKTVTLAGTMNDWTPSLDSFPLQQLDATHWRGIFAFPRRENLDFKLTLQPQPSDPWLMVEKGSGCEEVGNRTLIADTGARYRDTVQNWRNNAPCGD